MDKENQISSIAAMYWYLKGKANNKDVNAVDAGESGIEENELLNAIAFAIKHGYVETMWIELKPDCLAEMIEYAQHCRDSSIEQSEEKQHLERKLAKYEATDAELQDKRLKDLN